VPIAATIALEIIGPMPGTDISRGCRLSRRFLLCESSFQPRDVFLEALVVI
jgi:hypothetical protein